MGFSSVPWLTLESQHEASHVTVMMSYQACNMRIMCVTIAFVCKEILHESVFTPKGCLECLNRNIGFNRLGVRQMGCAFMALAKCKCSNNEWLIAKIGPALCSASRNGAAAWFST